MAASSGRPGLVRRLYDWVLSWADHPHGTKALGALAFAESSFFPIPPDVLLMALALARPRRAWYFAFVCTAGSVLGAVFGYGIGYGAWESVKDFFFQYVFDHETFDFVGHQYEANALIAIFTAAFTPIPFKVFTISAGVWHEHVSLPVLLAASVVGRGARFFLVGGLIRVFGVSIRTFLERYLNLLTIVFMILLVGGFFAIKFWLHG